jgi:hypothetical protein
MWLLPFLGVIAVILCGCDKNNTPKYSLDVSTPSHLVYSSSFSSDTGEARVYVSGPQKDFDTRINVEDLLKRKPIWTSRGGSEIPELLRVLAVHKQDPIPSTKTVGNTYHVVLIDNTGTRVMHFRVFIPQGQAGTGAVVYPSSDTGFCYVNDRIGAWLREHAKVAGGLTGSENAPASTATTPGVGGREKPQ